MYIQCPICGNIFEKTAANQKYCSKNCARKGRNALEIKRQKLYRKNPEGSRLICNFCGKKYKPASNNQKYCSQICGEKFRAGVPIPRRKPKKTIDDTLREMQKSNYIGSYGKYESKQYMLKMKGEKNSCKQQQ